MKQRSAGLLKLSTVCAALLAASAAYSAEAEEPKTVITGAQMEITGGGSSVVFSGGAKVKKGVNELSAEKIVQDKKHNRVEASGRVVFSSLTGDKEPLKGSSEKATYDLGRERGELSGGKPEIRYFVKSSTAPVVFRADSIKFDTAKEELYGKSRVEIITSSVTAYAPNAVLLQKEKKIVLTGPEPQPLVIYLRGGKQNKYRADKITFLTESDKVLLKGNVKAVMTVDEKENGK